MNEENKIILYQDDNEIPVFRYVSLMKICG